MVHDSRVWDRWVDPPTISRPPMLPRMRLPWFRFVLVPVSFVPAFFFVPSPIALSTELQYDPTLH